jgi:hypothetical protein
MRANKCKKSRESAKKKEDIVPPPKDKIIKFNFSSESIKCFINDKHPKTDRKHVSARYDFSMTDSKKYRQACE